MPPASDDELPPLGDALTKLVELAIEQHGGIVSKALPSPSAVRGLCALALVNLVGTVMTMKEAGDGHDEYIPKVDVHSADAALMITKPCDYEAAAEWLIATIRATKDSED